MSGYKQPLSRINADSDLNSQIKTAYSPNRKEAKSYAGSVYDKKN